MPRTKTWKISQQVKTYKAKYDELERAFLERDSTDENDENVVLSIGASEHNMSVMRNLQEQFIEGKNCDLEIRLKDSKIYAHKCLADMFFKKVGAELDNDMFYLDLKEYPRKVMTPLIDMMYHGNLSVMNSCVKDVISVAAHIGFTQACDLLRKHMRGTYRDSKKNQKPPLEKEEEEMQEPEVDQFVIKSEPPDDEIIDPDLMDTSNLRADVGASTATRIGNYSDIDTSKNIYIVYTPKDSETRDSEILPSLKFKENSKKLNDLIKDQDKTVATVTDAPYQTVKQILEKHAHVVPEESNTKNTSRKSKSSDDEMGPQSAKKSKVTDEEMFPTRIVKTEITNEPVQEIVGRGLKKIDNSNGVKSKDAMYKLSIASRKRGMKVTHVQSPGPQATNRPVGDYINTKNFREAAANRMLEKSIMFEKASKDNSGKQLRVNLKTKGGKHVKGYGEAMMASRNLTSLFYDNYETVVHKKKKANIDYVEAGKIEFSEGGKTIYPSQAIPKVNTGASTSKETSEPRKKTNLTMPKFTEDQDSETDDQDADEQDSDNETEMNKYLKGNRDARYFPPAGIVPKGCKSSYAQSIFLKTKKVTETITNKNGDVMVVTKEIPVRSTIFNPKKKAEHGVAAVVVCHPTKPVVRPVVRN